MASGPLVTAVDPDSSARAASQRTTPPATKMPAATNSETNGSMRSWPCGCSKSGGWVVR